MTQKGLKWILNRSLKSKDFYFRSNKLLLCYCERPCNTDVITKIKNTFFHTAGINFFSMYRKTLYYHDFDRKLD